MSLDELNQDWHSLCKELDQEELEQISFCGRKQWEKSYSIPGTEVDGVAREKTAVPFVGKEADPNFV